MRTARLPEGGDLVQRLLALSSDLGALDRGASLGPGLVQAFEGEQAFGEALFEGDEVSEGPGMGADDGDNRPLVARLVTRRSDPAT